MNYVYKDIQNIITNFTIFKMQDLRSLQIQQRISKIFVTLQKSNINDQMDTKYKYKKLLTPAQLGFLQYFMLPEKDEFDYVYRPGDDSFLMLSVLKNQLSIFPRSPTICQIGSGSGILSAHVNKWLKQTNNQPLFHFASDISLDACILSQKYYEHYNLNIQQICTSLLKGCTLLPEIMICNPPYVPTDVSEKQSEMKYLKQKIASVRDKKEIMRSPNKNLIAYSYMGGPEGLDTTRQLIKFITWETRLYLIVMGEQGLQTLKQEVQTGKTLSNKVKGTFQILQFYKKMNEQLYVVLIATKLL